MPLASETSFRALIEGGSRGVEVREDEEGDSSLWTWTLEATKTPGMAIRQVQLCGYYCWEQLSNQIRNDADTQERVAVALSPGRAHRRQG